jgi:transcriptional regulator with XRE-family HTH domain
MTLGERIRLYRDRKRLTQFELADRVGVDKMTIWRVENGADLKSQVLVKIAKQLGVRPDVLLGVAEEEADSELRSTKRALVRR